eukprot:363728-Pelagomonas_calceolata.AAC.2
MVNKAVPLRLLARVIKGSLTSKIVGIKYCEEGEACLSWGSDEPFCSLRGLLVLNTAICCHSLAPDAAPVLELSSIFDFAAFCECQCVNQ